MLIILSSFLFPLISHASGIDTIYEEFRENVKKYDSSNFEISEENVSKPDSFADKLIDKSKEFVFLEIKNSLIMFLKIIIICFMGSLTKIYIADSSFSEISFYACYCLVAYTLIDTFKDVSMLCGKNIEMLSGFMEFAVPTYATTLAMSGYGATASSVQGIFMGIAILITHVINTFIIPLLYSCGLIAVVNSVSTVIDLSKFVTLISKAVKYSMGIIMTIFAGTLTFSGLATASADNLSIRTAKYAVANFVPVVGGCLSEALHSVINSSAVLKNSMGYLCYLSIISICLFPVIKIAVVILVFRLTAACAEIISENKVGTMINSVGDVLSTMLGLLLLIIVMFVLIVGIMASIG